MLIQTPAPPAVVAPALQPPVATRLSTISQRDRPLTLTKGGRTETALVRHQIFIRTTARPGAAAVVEGQAVSIVPCAWTIEAYLQREICFYSMTGQTSCTDGVSKPLTLGETGQGDTPAGQQCDLQAMPVERAEARVIAAIETLTPKLVADDYRIVVRPMLAASGVTITESPKPAPSRASGS